MNTALIKFVVPSLLFSLSLTFPSNLVLAQLIPDSTLGAENSTVKLLEVLKQEIKGGAIRGNNLFHSFLEFNVNNGQSVYFTNPNGVNNILTRVTGNNISQILGILGVNGNANLFLLNPNGILFGNNARLDLNGSFIATTGDIKLGENGLFSATNIQGSTLLNTSPEVIFTNAQNTIENRANLVVKDGKNLILIAKEIIEPDPLNKSISLLNIENARLKPDESLGAENTQIEAIDETNDRVTGGAKREINLFHSFQEFNVENGRGVYFANPVGVENILARVTGNNISEIRGILGVEGNANLYFINPNGLFFNQNASLDLNGSFFASTAEAIIFDNFEYRAVNPNIPPTLVINVPTGLRFGVNPGDIILQNERDPNQNDLVTEESDAGDLPNNAQPINDNDTPPPFTIQGSLTGESDTDTYEIYLTANSSFDVSTIGTTEVDTRLFLFDSNGFGISANDDSNNTLQSTLPSYQVNQSGQYYLSISSSFNSPKNNEGNIFGNETTEVSPNLTIPEGFIIEATPMGIGGNSPVTAWTNFGLETGNYVIKLNGGLQNEGNLGVNSGKNLAFIGGNVIVDGMKMISPNSNILLGGVKESATVTINPDKSLNFPDSINRGNISLVNQTQINVQGNQGGNVNLIGNQINLNNSLIQGGINGLGFSEAKSGNINLNAINTISLNNSTIGNILTATAEGNVGNINLNSSSVFLENNSQINTSLEGKGTIGLININARDNLILDQSSLITNTISINGAGSSDGININTKDLNLNNGSAIATAVGAREILNITQLQSPRNTSSSSDFFSLREGNTGKISIFTTGNVNLTNNSGIVNVVFPNARGNSSGINIETQNLNVSDGSQVNASSQGIGNAGKINIIAHESINLNGTNPNINNTYSFISSTVESGGKGNSEGIDINTKTLHLINGGRISASVNGDNLEIPTEGNGGLIKINASDKIIIEGQNSSGLTSFIDSTVNGNSIGNSQGIVMETNNLTLQNSGSIITSSGSQGNAGLIKITAKDTLTLDGETSNPTAFRSSILSTIESGGKGMSQGIEINTNSLNLINGGRIGSSVFGDNPDIPTEGDAGLIKINATGNIILQGQNSQDGAPSFIDSLMGFNTIGNSQGVEIQTNSLTLKDAGVIVTSASGEGNAGKIVITADDGITIDGQNIAINGLVSSIGSTVENGAKGDSQGIEINTTFLKLLNGGRISTSIIGDNPEIPTTGNAGLIKINASQSIILEGQNNIGFPSLIDSLINTNTIGNSQGIEINTNTLNIKDSGVITTSTIGRGDAGKIFITAHDGITLDGSNRTMDNLQSSIISTVESGARGDSQGIEIKTTALNLLNGARIGTSTFADDINNPTIGNTGLIKITASEGITLEGKNNNNQPNVIDSIIGEFTIGNSQGIDITTPTLSVKDGGTISATTLGEGNAGLVKITANDIFLDGETTFTVDGENINLPSNISSTLENKTVNNRQSEGILINTGKLSLTNGATIVSRTEGTGNAGLIEIQANDSIIINGQTSNWNPSRIDSSVLEFAQGNSEGIVINTQKLTLDNFGSITASTAGKGNAGEIIIFTDTPLILNNGGKITSALEVGGEGKGGNIIINAPSLSLDHQSEINASTSGVGEGGFVQLFIDDNINLNNGSQIATAVEKTGIGIGGIIEITTKQLYLDNQSQLRASTLGQGNADSILVNADTVTITNGSKVSTETSSNFKAGNITFNLKDSLFLSGIGSGLFANTESNSRGDGGNIIINSPFINLNTGGEIAVNSLGTGKGGDITIKTNTLSLDSGDINAQTLSSDGGNLALNIRDLLTLGNSSNITATAGTAQAGGDGGNIILNAPFIISYPSNPVNTIAANAFEGKGGNIDITTNIILGGNFLTISASSQLGLDGEVIIRSPEIDPTSGLISINSDFVDAENLINQNVCKFIGNKLAGSFSIIGKGGLPAQPTDFNSQNVILTPWLNLDSDKKEKPTNISLSSENLSLSPSISFSCGRLTDGG